MCTWGDVFNHGLPPGFSASSGKYEFTPPAATLSIM
jgi:hypothetical protein